MAPVEGQCSPSSQTLPTTILGIWTGRLRGGLGLEKTPEQYVNKLVAGFREVRRVLRDDGTLWLNLGDLYTGSGKGGNPDDGKQSTNQGSQSIGVLYGKTGETARIAALTNVSRRWTTENGMAPKNLVGIPWRVAFALQADGWYLRSDIIWHKPNPMPESVTDRPTKAHEYIFLLSKCQSYFYDAEAIKEKATTEPHNSGYVSGDAYTVGPMERNGHGQRQEPERVWSPNGFRNKRSVWTVQGQSYPESHFATFPEDLIKPCILAGTSAMGCCPMCWSPWERIIKRTPMEINRSDRGEKVFGNNHSTAASGTMTKPSEVTTLGWQPTCDCGGTETIPCTVLDPFAGTFTTGQVALELGRKCIGIELNPKYISMAEARTNVTPGLPLA